MADVVAAPRVPCWPLLENVVHSARVQGYHGRMAAHVRAPGGRRWAVHHGTASPVDASRVPACVAPGYRADAVN